MRPHPVPTDRKRNIGRTRLRLLKASAEPLGNVFGAVPLAALHQTAVLWKKDGALTGFRHRVLVFQHFNNFTTFPV